MQQVVDGPRTGRTEAQVLATIASASPLVRHGVDVLLPSTLEQTDETLPVDWDSGGQVRWSYRPTTTDASAVAVTEIRRTADFTLAGDVDDTLILGRLFRPWVDMTGPDGVTDRFYRGVYISSLPRVVDDGKAVRRQLEMVGREHRWRTRTLPEPVTVAAATDVFTAIADDLSTVFGVTVHALPAVAKTMGQDMVFDQGVGYLDKWSRLCRAVGYDSITTTVDGKATTKPLSLLAGMGPEWTYAPGEGRIVVAGQIDPLDPELPNVVRFSARRGPSLGNIEGNGYRTWRNQSTGPGSIDARDGEQVFRLVDVDASNQTELDAFALSEAQRYLAGGGTRFTGRVGLNPLHDDRDVIRLTRPRLGVDAVALVTDHTFPMRRIRSEADVLMDIVAEPRVELA